MELTTQLTSLILIIIFTQGTLGQVLNSYWQGPPRTMWNWNPYGYSAGGPSQQRTLWQSGWFPIQSLKSIDMYGRAFPASYGNSRQQVMRHMQEQFPQLYSNQRATNSRYPKVSVHHIHGSPSHQQHDPVINVGSPFLSSDYQPSVYSNEVKEVIASCDRLYCYKSCRLLLIGGGRCTKAGCMCYHASFRYNGEPMTLSYPSDDIWYELSQFEQYEILDTMRSGKPKVPPATGPPNPRPSQRPTMAPRTTTTTESWFGGGEINEQTRPTQTTTESVWDNGDGGFGGWWGSGNARTTTKQPTRPTIGAGGDWWNGPEPTTRPTYKPRSTTYRPTYRPGSTTTKVNTYRPTARKSTYRPNRPTPSPTTYRPTVQASTYRPTVSKRPSTYRPTPRPSTYRPTARSKNTYRPTARPTVRSTTDWAMGFLYDDEDEGYSAFGDFLDSDNTSGEEESGDFNPFADDDW